MHIVHGVIAGETTCTEPTVVAHPSNRRMDRGIKRVLAPGIAAWASIVITSVTFVERLVPVVL